MLPLEIGSFVDLLSPIFGVLALIVLLFMSSAVLAGRHRRRAWKATTEEMARRVGGNGGEMVRAHGAQRASDSIENLVRRFYYVVATISAMGMVILPVVPVEQKTRFVIWLALTGITFITAFTLLLHWRDWDEEDEALLRRILRSREERALSRAGLIVRDELTGIYTPDYWLHALEIHSSRLLRRPTPVTCLMIDVLGLEDLRRELGNELIDDLLSQIAREIINNVRPDDFVCRIREGRFAIALLRCPSEYADGVGYRVVTNVQFVLMGQLDDRYRSMLQFEWESATLPGDALTPVQLLRVAERSLERENFLPVRVAEGGGQAG